MDTTALIRQARALILNGDTQGALDALHPLNDRPVQLITAQFRAVREQMIKDTLPFDQAQREMNKVNDQLMRRLDDLEQGRTGNGFVSKHNKRLVWAASAALLLAVAASLFFLRSPGKMDGSCPQFQPGKGYKIVFFPFQKIAGEGIQRPTLAVMNRVSELTQKREIATQTGLYQVPDDHSLSVDQIEGLAASCGADLVIHGDFNAVTKDSVQLRLRYRFFQKDQTVGQSTTASLPNVAAMDKMRSIDDVVFSICAQIAIRNGRKDIAQTWLGKIKQPDDRTEGPLRELVK